MALQFRKIKSLRDIEFNAQMKAQLVYPKLIVYVDKCTIVLCDLLDKEDKKLTFKFEHDIVDTALQEPFLWIALTTGDMIVIEVISANCLKIENNNVGTTRISKINNFDEEHYILNDAEDVYLFPYVTTDITQALKEGVTKLPMVWKKAPVVHKYGNLQQYQGLYYEVDSGNLDFKCPVTKLQETTRLSERLLHVSTWEHCLVLSTETSIWTFNFLDSKVTEFENHSRRIYPLTCYKTGFYYLLWSEHEVELYCAWSELALDVEQSNDIGLNTSVKLTSQESLKLQLTHMVENVISSNDLLPNFQGMKLLFEKMDDLQYLTVVAVTLCKHNLSYKSILYLLQNRVNETFDQGLIYFFNDKLIKIELFEYVNSRKLKFDNDFFEHDCKELCIKFLSQSNVDLACICWLKYTQVKVPVSSSDVTEILNVIPSNIKLSTLIVWLQNYVPYLLYENPFYIDMFVKWTTDRVLNLEQSSYWPKLGLKFIDEVQTVLLESLSIIPIRPISMDDLDKLKNCICDIIELKEKYKINMLLRELSSQNPHENVLVMLRRCYTEDLELFTVNYLPLYAARHNLDLDDILRSFIEIETSSSGGGVDGTRLNILLGCFCSVTSKLECFLNTLKKLDVPWDHSVNKLAVTTAALRIKDFTLSDGDKILAKEVEKELTYAKLKVIFKKYNFSMASKDYVLLIHKLVDSPNTDLDDLKVVTATLTTYSCYGYILYINKCIKLSEISNAKTFFDGLTSKEKKVVLKALQHKYELTITSSTNDVSCIEKNYLDFLSGTLLLDVTQLKKLQNMYHLKNSYNIKFDMNSISTEEHCVTKAASLLSYDNDISSSGRGSCVSELIGKHETKIASLNKLLKRTSAKNEIRKIVESMLTYPVSQNVCLMSKYRNNPSLLLESYCILTEIVGNCREEYIHHVMGFLSVLNSFYILNSCNKNLTVTWRFHYIFMPMSTVNAYEDLIQFYACKNPIKALKDELPNIISRSGFVPLIMIVNITNSNDFTDDNNSILEEKEIVIKKLISKAALSQNLDLVFLTTLLLVIHNSDNTVNGSYLLDMLKGHNEVIPPAIEKYLFSPLVQGIFAVNPLSPNSVSYSPHHILKTKFNLNFNDIAVPDITEETWDVKVILFHILRQFPDCSFDRIVEFCDALNVSVNDGLSLQLISLLTTWELNYKLQYDTLGCRNFLLETNEKELVTKCLLIWENIKNKEFVIDILNDFWKNGEVTLHGRLISINPYYYEVYVCIYHLLFNNSMEVHNVKAYFLLNFLKYYKRTGSPKQYEFELFSVKGIFPEIGLYRLPFHLFKRDDMWSNLKSEITLQSYENWLPVVSLLSLDADLQTAKDMVCSNALKQTMTTRKKNDTSDGDSKENEPWRLTSREEPLLRAAHRCVRHIANMEWAAACLFYVLQGCTRGADQVAAAHLCYQFAQRWAALQPGNRAVKQMERLYSSLSTRHALHKVNWAREEFIRLTGEPTQLIRALYLHPDFINKTSSHDINRVVNEIADKNGLNVSTSRIQILESILEKSLEKQLTKNCFDLNIKELMTAKYILKATCPKMGAIYLSRIAFDDESDYNKCKKLRAMQCLMSIVDTDTAVRVTHKDRDALWPSLIELLFIVNLENIDLPWIIPTFCQDKISSIEQLVQSASNINGLKITAEMIVRYGTPELMQNVIPSLLRASLYEELILLLLRIPAPINSIILDAWRSVLVSPFQRADHPITDRQKKNCIKAANLLPICPRIDDSDLIEIWKNCVRCKCLGIGCLTLPYMTERTRKTLPELRIIDKRSLVASLKNLHSETYLVTGAMEVLENITSRP